MRAQKNPDALVRVQNLLCVRSRLGCSFCREDMHYALVVATAGKFHGAVNKGEYRMVSAESDILTGMVSCSALADDDIAGNNFLATPDLNAEAFTVAFATVFGTTDSFFMCHYCII